MPDNSSCGLEPDPADDVNNAEHVTVDASEPGLYLIRVLGTELPFYSEPGQTFALVLVGELEESDQCDADGYVDGAPAWVVLCDQGRVDYTGFNLPADVSLPAGRNLQVLSATDAFVVERGFYAVYNAPGQSMMCHRMPVPVHALKGGWSDQGTSRQAAAWTCR